MTLLSRGCYLLIRPQPNAGMNFMGCWVWWWLWPGFVLCMHTKVMMDARVCERETRNELSTRRPYHVSRHFHTRLLRIVLYTHTHTLEM